MDNTTQPSQPHAPHPLLAPRPKRSRRTGLWVTLGVLAVGAVVGWQLISRNAPAAATTTTQVLSTASIKTQDLTESTTLTGTIEFEDPVNAPSPGSGYVVSIATEGSVLQRGDVIAMVSADVTNDQILSAQQRVLSAQTSVDNANAQYKNTVASASDADIAAAQAQLDKAQTAYQALLDGPTDQQLADAQLAIDRANASLDQATTQKGLAWLDLQSAQSDYCAMATVPVDVCSAGDIPLTSSARDQLLTAIDDFTTGGDPASAQTTQMLLDKDTGYANALISYNSAVLQQQNAVQALADLQAGASDSQLAAAHADVLSAQSRLDDLKAGASSTEKAQAYNSIKNAKLNLQLAQQDLASLVAGPKVSVLFYGPLHMWRTLSEGVTPGTDITQLETNLLALGFDDDGAMVVDDTFDEATTAAVEAWQESLGLDQTGVIDLGTIMYVDGPSQVTSAMVIVGDGVNQQTPVAELTPTERVVDTLTKTNDTATVTETEQTTQRITTQIDVSDRSILSVGMPVTVTLPDDSEIDATVESIGDVAITQTGQGGNTTSVVDVVFTPSTSVDPVWTGASVDIDVVTSLTKNALTVPVTALLATLQGNYAVQVVNDDGSTALVPVTTGSFTNGYVQITGDGLADGMKVVVP